MNMDAVLARVQPCLGYAWVVFMVAAFGGPAGSLGADRVVLCEEFTQLTGLPCQRAGLALEMLLDDYRVRTRRVREIYTEGLASAKGSPTA